MKNKTYLAFGSLLLTTLCLGNEPPGRIQVLESWRKDELTLQFVAIPKVGLKLNTEAPWTLELDSKTTLLQYSQHVYKKNDFKQDRFQIKAKYLAKSGEGKLAYKLTAFYCTIDKSRCMREVVDSTYRWKKS